MSVRTFVRRTNKKHMKFQNVSAIGLAIRYNNENRNVCQLRYLKGQQLYETFSIQIAASSMHIE